MIVNDLYQTALIEPAETGKGNELFAVSGYASATFARRHLMQLCQEQKIDFKLNLIIGMPSKHSDHSAFLQLLDEYQDSFRVYYLNSSPPVHAKAYSWYKDDKPIVGYAGSANYSQFGFFENKQVNQITREDPLEIKNFFETLLLRSTPIEEAKIKTPELIVVPSVTGSVQPGQIQWLIPDQAVKISFLDTKGVVPVTSGLNWGQRKSKATNKKTGKVTYSQRNPDQAYLSIKKDVRKKGFLPERGFTFTLLTDDGQTFDCVVAQDGGKAVHTTYDNSELGGYIRDRLGVGRGTFIETKHLEAYGRTDFTLIKIDDETFKLDLSV